ALPAVADVLVRPDRQLQPVGLAVRRRAAGPEPRHGLFELPPPVGLPARGPRRGGSGVQHERRRVLAPEPDGARAGALLGPRPALGGALPERHLGPVRAGPAALDPRRQGPRARLEVDVPQRLEVGVAPRGTQLLGTHEPLDLGFGYPQP